jgi:hypothetical protein
MSFEGFITKTKNISEGNTDPRQASDANLEKAVAMAEDFFDKNKRWIDLYSGDGSLKVENGAKVGLDTFAIDLQNGTMYYSPRFYAEQGFKPSFCLFATLHELEHLRELIDASESKDGILAWERNLEAIKGSEAYGILDNCFDDIKMNRTVASRAPVVSYVPEEIYSEKLFPEDNMVELPKHLQFSYALVRDANLHRDSIVSPDVRSELELLKHFKLENGKEIDLIDFFSRPQTTMTERVAFQEQYLRPIMEKFLEEDKEDPKFNKGKKKAGENDEKKGDEKDGEAGKNDKDDKNEKGGEDGGKSGTEKKEKQKSKKGSKAEGGEGEQEDNSGEIFKKYYDEYRKKNPKPKEISVTNEGFKKKIEGYIKQKKSTKTPKERAEEEYARKNDVSPSDFRQYQKYKKEVIETMTDKETGVCAMDSLREEMKRIVSERRKRETAPKYPVEDGDRLALPVEAYVAVKGGDLQPKVWEITETKEILRKRISNFDLILVADRSGSMQGDKLSEQRKAVAMTLETLKELYEEIELEKEFLDEPLSIRSACYSFGSNVDVIKKLGEGLSEKDRVTMYKALGSAPGSTKDFLALEKISSDMDKATEEDIKLGKRKSLVIVTTDGESDNPSKLATAIGALKSKGVIIYGVGVTNDAGAVLTNYGNNGIIADSADDISSIYKKILDRELSEL